MKFTKIFALALCASLFFGSCDDDDDDNITVPQIVSTNFNQQYPNASAVSWENDNQYATPYLKAEFKIDGVEAEAWYTADGTWVKTEKDYYDPLPQVITDYIATHYDGYKVDEVNWVETPQKNYYEIELEQGKTDVELNIQEDGTVISIVQK